jgi:hypothetical protein
MTKSLWKLPEPWTLKNAPTAPWKTTEQFSTSFHRHCSYSTRGHFYFVKNGDISISP